MAVVLTAAVTESVTAADGSTLPGVRLSATGLNSGASTRRVRWWRQLLGGDWVEVIGTNPSAGTTTAAITDWICPTAVLDPSTPATPYRYAISQYIEVDDLFAVTYDDLGSPGYCNRPGSLPWLVHPTDPALSLPVTLEADTGRERRNLGATHDVYGRRAPVVTTSGARLLRAGTLTLNVPRAFRSDLAALLDDGSPLYLAQACNAADTDDGYLAIESVSDDVIVQDVLRVECAYQQTYPGRLSPPSYLAGSAYEWWL